MTDYTKTASDPAGATDAAPLRDYGKAKQDTAGALDKGVAAARSIPLPTADTAGAADAIQPILGKNAADTAGAADGGTTQLQTLVRPPLDTLRMREGVVVTFAQPELDNYQFELLGAPEARFGYGEVIAVEKFDPGTSDTRSQDQSGIGDYRMFGRDVRTPPVWSFALWTDTHTPADALGWIDLFARSWDAPDLRGTPNLVTALRYKVGDRIRRVYGRPRALDIPTPDLIFSGRVALQAQFVLADGVSYEDDEDSIYQSITQMESAGGGFALPLILPLVTATEAEPRQEMVTIGGTRPTWVDLTFYGPAHNPWAVLGGSFRFSLRGTIGSNEAITVSGKPWSMGITRDDGTAVPDMLDPRARLASLRLSPGDYSVQHGGFATTSDAGIEVRWRNAYHGF